MPTKKYPLPLWAWCGLFLFAAALAIDIFEIGQANILVDGTCRVWAFAGGIVVTMTAESFLHFTKTSIAQKNCHRGATIWVKDWRDESQLVTLSRVTVRHDLSSLCVQSQVGEQLNLTTHEGRLGFAWVESWSDLSQVLTK